MNHHINPHNLDPYDLGRIDARCVLHGTPAPNPFPPDTLAHQDWREGFADEAADALAEIDGVAA